MWVFLRVLLNFLFLELRYPKNCKFEIPNNTLMHFLVTDDLFTMRLKTGILLRSMGYTYDEAAHGDEAIEKLMLKDYDLILMDIEMPVRNGLETTRYIRDNFEGKKRRVPIIAVTAHDPEDFFESYENECFSGLITKPITGWKLESIIRRIQA
jgi:CheY-like chemotaxis protein